MSWIQPYMPLILYSLLGLVILVLNKVVLNNDPSVNTIGLVVLGAAGGYMHGLSVPTPGEKS